MYTRARTMAVRLNTQEHYMAKPTPYSYVTTGGVRNTRVTVTDAAATLDQLAAHEPLVLGIHTKQYHAASKRERGDFKKELPYFVGGVLSPPTRHDNNVQSRTLLTLDVERNPKKQEDEPPPPDLVTARLKELGGAGWVYTSLSHTPAAPRYRVVLPLGKPIKDTEALRLTTLKTARMLGIEEWTTPESWVLSQPMYLPAKLKGDSAFYDAYVRGKHWAPAKAERAPTEAAPIPDDKPDFILHAIKAAGLYLGEADEPGRHFMRCPFHDQHEAENDTQTMYMEANYGGYSHASVQCFDTAPDEPGQRHLTFSKLVQWLKANDHLTQDQQTNAGVLDDYDSFDAKADLGRMLDGDPVAREWAIEKFAPVGKVTVLAGPGGVSKSLLMLHILVHSAMEQEWAAFRSADALRSLYVSYEDDTQELHKRVNTLATALREQDDGVTDALYDVNSTIRANLRMFAADEEASAWLLLTKSDRYGQPERAERVDWLIGYLKAKNIKLLCLDPAVYTHQLEENNIADMATYMQTLSYVAKQAECAVVVLHHMHKMAGWSALDDINQGSLRGASSFADNARSVAVVVSMPIKDAELFGLPADPDTTSRYAVLKHVKHNYSAPLPTMVFERKGPLLIPRPNITRMGKHEVAEAREQVRTEEQERRVLQWVDRVLAVLKEHTGAITQNQIAVELKTKPATVKKVLEHCEQNDWIELEEGPNRSRLASITKLGKSYLRSKK